MRTLKNLKEAEDGSYYTILGAGGDLNDWVNGYDEILIAENIGQPSKWYQTTGAVVNDYAHGLGGEFPPDLTILLFPLDGLDLGKLAMFRLSHDDKWFDDVIANMR